MSGKFRIVNGKDVHEFSKLGDLFDFIANHGQIDKPVELVDLVDNINIKKSQSNLNTSEQIGGDQNHKEKQNYEHLVGELRGLLSNLSLFASLPVKDLSYLRKRLVSMKVSKDWFSCTPEQLYINKQNAILREINSLQKQLATIGGNVSDKDVLLERSRIYLNISALHEELANLKQSDFDVAEVLGKRVSVVENILQTKSELEEKLDTYIGLHYEKIHLSNMFEGIRNIVMKEKTYTNKRENYQSPILESLEQLYEKITTSFELWQEKRDDLAIEIQYDIEFLLNNI